MIADRWHWGYEEIQRLPVVAALHFAMRAERSRWQQLDDMREAVAFLHMAPKDQAALIQRINFMLGGPALVDRWENRLTERQRAGVAEAEAQLEATRRKLAEKNVRLATATGKPPIESLFKK